MHSAQGQTPAPVSGDEGRLVGPNEGAVIAGKYQLMRLLGQGGMGAVYEAKNLGTLKRCAVKMLLSPEFGQNAAMVTRFFREAQASSVIESDHIVTIYDSGSDPQTGYPYMVMEMLQGEDLEHTLARVGALHPMAVAKVIMQAAIGLAKAHEKGVVHRDIKPANLYLTGRDSGDLIVKLLDFGIAKVKMESFSEQSQGLTRTGSMLGTPLYMSPEQAKGKSSAIDARSDVWSLGAVMYELLTGSLPFADAESLGELMVSIITADIPLLQDRSPWVPPELAEVAHRAMSRDLERRFKNAGELRDALAAIIPDGPRITPDMLIGVPQEYRAYVAPRLQMTDDGMLRATTRTGLAMTQPGSETVKKKSSGGVVAAAAVAGLLLVGGGGAGVWALTRHKPRPADAAPPATVIVEKRVETTRVEPAAAVVKTFDLTVGPEGAEVEIEGKKVALENGKVSITGSPGEARKVVVKAHGREKAQVVAITTTGLLPDKIELPAAGGGGPSKPKPGGGEAASPKPEKGAEPPKPKPKPAIDTNWPG